DNMRVTNEVLRLGDFNNDGHINTLDIKAGMNALTNTAAYLANPTGLPSGDAMTAQDLLTVGDINGDHVFNNADIQTLLDDLKAGLGSDNSVPEPASLLLTALALPALLLARRSRKTRN